MPSASPIVYLRRRAELLTLGLDHIARLLVSALQLAGYRAEMDDDGDVWWDPDDGDQYFDAPESQQPYHAHADGSDDGNAMYTAHCPICRDPEKYGLGYIVEEDERGTRMVREYREKIKKQREREWY